MKSIAKSLNVSVTTISKVLNGHSDISDKTRREVLQRIAEMGYEPNMMAMNLRRSKASLVALILSDISKPYFGRVIEGYESTLNEAGFQTMTFSSMENGERETHFIRQVASMNMAGIIIDPAQDSDCQQTALKQAGIPYVFSNRFLDAENDYYVAADNEKAGYQATSYLLHRKPNAPVFCVNGPCRISPTIMRYAGYRRAMDEHGLEIKAEYIYDDCYGLADAYAVGMKIAQIGKPPFSIFCNTDQFAIGVMRALHDYGYIVPQDVSIISVDDIDTARYLIPSLTTISLPKRRIGEESAKMLIALMSGKTVENPRILLEPELIIRETT